MVVYQDKSSRRIAASKTTQRRWMLFVDGENLTIRTEALATKESVKLKVGPHYSPEVFVWDPHYVAAAAAGVIELPDHLLDDPIRAYYYTSATGDDDALNGHRDALTALGFKAIVIKKQKARGSKGVDISLATDLLANACSGNMDAAVLVAGDGDYVPLVEEVQRRGRQMFVSFWSGPDVGVSDALRRVSDGFLPLSKNMITALKV